MVSARVVVGVLGPQGTVLDVALEEARRRSAQLVVVHAAGLPVNLPDLSAAAIAYDQAREAGEAILHDVREAVQKRDPDLQVSYVLSTLEPVAALRHEAEGTELLVLGTDSLSWFDRLLGGAVTQRVVRHTEVPVVVVPATLRSDASGVVVALDGDSSESAAMAFAVDQAQARREPLTVVHAVPPGTTLEDAEARKVDVAEVVAGWRTDYPDLELHPQFVVAAPDEACLAATEGSAVLVLGTPRNRSMPLALTRPVSAAIVDRARCVVAVVPGRTSVR